MSEGFPKVLPNEYLRSDKHEGAPEPGETRDVGGMPVRRASEEEEHPTEERPEPELA